MLFKVNYFYKSVPQFLSSSSLQSSGKKILRW
ncbi:MAG: hypothetical protein ACI825_001576, partial [Planctomycetota bacterium]